MYLCSLLAGDAVLGSSALILSVNNYYCRFNCHVTPSHSLFIPPSGAADTPPPQAEEAAAAAAAPVKPSSEVPPSSPLFSPPSPEASHPPALTSFIGGMNRWTCAGQASNRQ